MASVGHHRTGGAAVVLSFVDEVLGAVSQRHAEATARHFSNFNSEFVKKKQP